MHKSKYFVLFWVYAIVSIVVRLAIAGGISSYSGINLLVLVEGLTLINYIEIFLGILHFSVLLFLVKVWKKPSVNKSNS